MIIAQKNGRKAPTEMDSANITHFIADQKYVEAFHANGSLLIENTIKELEQKLAPRFIRIHRNAIVRADLIRAYELIMENDAGEPTSLRGARVAIEGVPHPIRASRPNIPKVRAALEANQNG